MNPDELDETTRDLAAKLLKCRVEERDGSFSCIPDIKHPPAAEDPLLPVMSRLDLNQLIQRAIRQIGQT